MNKQSVCVSQRERDRERERETETERERQRERDRDRERERNLDDMKTLNFRAIEMIDMNNQITRD